jgi:DNA-binding transcriptional ArsR family regulator
MSRHLRILLQAGIVEDERVPDDARLRVFRLRPGSLVAVQAFLDQVQADWNLQLQSFKRHAERKERR